MSADDQLVDVEDGGVAVVEDEVMPQTFGPDEIGLGLENGEKFVVQVVDVSELKYNFITGYFYNPVNVITFYGPILHTKHRLLLSFGYCYHLCLAQSDHIKRLLLYLQHINE